MKPRNLRKITTRLLLGSLLIGALCLSLPAFADGNPPTTAANEQSPKDPAESRHRRSPRKYRFSKNGREVNGIERPPEVMSCFHDLRKGRFEGKGSGLLVVDIPTKDGARVRHLVPFENTVATLEVTPDEYEIYDVSYKKYSIRSPQGVLSYTTYADANALSLTIGESTYEFSVIDGGCDAEIAFLRYDFLRDEEREYLVLTVEKPIRLDGENDHTKQVVLNPGSVLVISLRKPESK